MRSLHRSGPAGCNSSGERQLHGSRPSVRVDDGRAQPVASGRHLRRRDGACPIRGGRHRVGGLEGRAVVVADLQRVRKRRRDGRAAEGVSTSRTTFSVDGVSPSVPYAVVAHRHLRQTGRQAQDVHGRARRSWRVRHDQFVARPDGLTGSTDLDVDLVYLPVGIRRARSRRRAGRCGRSPRAFGRTRRPRCRRQNETSRLSPPRRSDSPSVRSVLVDSRLRVLSRCLRRFLAVPAGSRRSSSRSLPRAAGDPWIASQSAAGETGRLR